MKFKKIRVLNFVFTIILFFGAFCVEAAGPQELRYLRAVHTICQLALTDLGADQASESPVEKFLAEYLIPRMADRREGANTKPGSFSFYPKTDHRTLEYLSRPPLWRMAKTFTRDEWSQFENQLIDVRSLSRWRMIINNKNKRWKARFLMILGGNFYFTRVFIYPFIGEGAPIYPFQGALVSSIFFFLQLPLFYALGEIFYFQTNILSAKGPTLLQLLGDSKKLMLRVPVNQDQFKAISKLKVVTKSDLGEPQHEDDQVLKSVNSVDLADTPFGFWKRRPYELQIINFQYAGKYVLEMRIVKR